MKGRILKNKDRIAFGTNAIFLFMENDGGGKLIQRCGGIMAI